MRGRYRAGIKANIRSPRAVDGSTSGIFGQCRRLQAVEFTQTRPLVLIKARIELGNGTYLSSPSVADYAGAFLAGRHDPYVRIDYTQHCISALMELGEGMH